MLISGPQVPLLVATTLQKPRLALPVRNATFQAPWAHVCLVYLNVP